MRVMRDAWRVALLCVLFIALISPARADDNDTLAALDLEELMEVEVVTATRRAEPLTQVAGAVTVLDEEDIFHSGATTLPDVLKLVPGVHVVQMDLDRWIIGVRGFNGILSSKHLVMIDGRPITSPTTGDVSWGNTVPLSEVKRIEVVRGTWTHLWGADSFTGVINVITKSAAETQGGQSVTSVGTSGIEQTLRYGGAFGNSAHYRATVGGWEKSNHWTATDDDKYASSNWSKRQGEVRVDWENAFTDSLSLQAGLATASIEDSGAGSPRIYDAHIRDTTNGFAQFTWNRALGLDAGVNFRTSYSHMAVAVDDLRGGTNVLDAEVEYAAVQSGRHRMTYGVGARYVWDDMESGDSTTIDEDRRYSFTSNGFVQDRVTLVEESLYLILGTKLDYFGEESVEFQPTMRLLHTREDEEYWLAISRAVRADTRWQRSGSYSIEYRGDEYTVDAPDTLTTEKLISYEVGHRRRITHDMNLDIAAYINEYDELVMLDYDRATRTATLNNSLEGTSYGLETMLEWDVERWLTLIPTGSVQYQSIFNIGEGVVGESIPEEGFTYALKLQALFKPAASYGFDFLVGYTDGPGERNIPGYLCLEAHTYWKATENLTLELTGRNLAEASEQYSTVRIGPSADLRITWNF